MTEISFTSRLKPVKLDVFKKCTSSLSYDGFVDYPWGINSSKVKQDVFTNNICDCTACLITDGKKAMLMHLLPSCEANHYPKRIFNYINSYFYLPNKNLQAVLIGSHPEKISQDIFNKFQNFLNKFQIPTTILKTGKSPTGIAYRTCIDEVMISNRHIDNALKEGKTASESLKSGFEQVKISEYDEI